MTLDRTLIGVGVVSRYTGQRRSWVTHEDEVFMFHVFVFHVSPIQGAIMSKRACLSFLVIAFAAFTVRAADETFNPITKDMSGWKYKNQKASLWKVVGDVKLDDSNNKQLSPSGEAGATPLLVNDLKVGQHGTDIYTEKEFGDCEVHVELMVPKGSNSGVYLMGRYEVQVLDSFGKKKPTKSDLGGIYNTADPIAENYEAKAPGEWQTLDIVFETP